MHSVIVTIFAILLLLCTLQSIYAESACYKFDFLKNHDTNIIIKTRNTAELKKFIEELQDCDEAIEHILEKATLPTPYCSVDEVPVAGHDSYSSNVMEDFMAQKIKNLIEKTKILKKRNVNIAIVSTWNVNCSLANFARTIVNNINSQFAKYVDWSVAKIETPDKNLDTQEWPEVNVIASIDKQDPEQYYEVGKSLADGEYDFILMEHEFALFEGQALDRFLEGYNYKEYKSPANIIVTLHTIPRYDGYEEFVKKLATQIGHFVELYDEECIYMVNYLKIARQKCISKSNMGMALRDKQMLKDFLGIQNRKVLFNFGMVSANKLQQDMTKALTSLQHTMPELLFIQIGKGAEIYAEAQNGLSDVIVWSNIQAKERLVELIMQASDLVVTPVTEEHYNVYASGTVLYALQRGIPVVSTPLNYDSHHVLDEGQGQFVQKGSWQELETTIANFFTAHTQNDRQEHYRKLFCRGRAGSFEQLGEQYFALLGTENLQLQQNEINKVQKDSEDSKTKQFRVLVQVDQGKAPGMQPSDQTKKQTLSIKLPKYLPQIVQKPDDSEEQDQDSKDNYIELGYNGEQDFTGSILTYGASALILFAVGCLLYRYPRSAKSEEEKNQQNQKRRVPSFYEIELDEATTATNAEDKKL